MASEQRKVIKTQGKINISALPASGYIDFVGSVSYSYLPSGGGTTIQKSANLTSQRLNINTASLSINSTVDKAYADVGETITKTIVLSNVGTTSANNVTITDAIPGGATFVSNSLRVNGSVISGANPSSGYNIGSVQVGVTTVTYQTVVATIPNTNPMTSTAAVNYTYTVDPATPNTKSGNKTSNSVSTEVKHADLSSSMSADKSSVLVGGVITYSVPIKVTGNTNAINVAFTSNIPTGTSFVPNSVTINGATQSGVSATNISVGTISAGQTTTITFQVNVNSIPAGGNVVNSGAVAYSYTVDPALPGSKSSTSNTNTVTIGTSQLTVNSTKAVDKAGAEVGDNISYTISISNTGSVAINNVKLLDTIPTSTSLVPNSVTINGAVQSGSNPAPPTGIAVGTINAGGTTTVKFTVKVDSAPSGGTINNSGTIIYNYTSNPANPNGESGGMVTNSVSTSVVKSGLSANKSVDKTAATIGDTVTYTIVLTNGGTVEVTNVNLKDTIPNGASLVPDSVKINGATQSGATTSNLPIGTIGIGTTTTITFSVKVNSIPSPNTLVNSASITYKYTVDPGNPGGASGSINTNSVTTNLGQATLEATKSVNKVGAGLGDAVTYTIAVKNTGDLPANEVILIDTIPNGMTFTSNSVTINGITQSGANPNPPTGITLGTIGAGNTSTVTFRITISTIPNPNTISNIATVGYKYSADPLSPTGVSKVANSNNVTTQINQATLSAVKTANKSGATIGDEIIYSIVISNSGNVDATNVKLLDTIPIGTSFVSNSLTLNGLVKSGESPAPPTGVAIGTLVAGSMATVSFKVTVTTVPTGNSISNSGNITYNYTVDPSLPNGTSGSINTAVVTTAVGQATLSAVKSANKAGATIGDEIEYTIVLINSGNVAANNISVIDTIPVGVSYKANSLKVNGNTQAGQTPENITISSIPSGQTTTVTFIVNVSTIPATGKINNSAAITYKFTVDPISPNGASGGVNTNIISTNIGEAKLSAVKSADKSGATIGDTVTYTVELTNTGNLAANTVIFKDTIPLGMTIVPNSVKINGVAQSGASPEPPNGVSVGTINPGNKAIILFKTTITTVPASNSIENIGIANYKFTSDPNTPNGASGEISTNKVSTFVASVVLNLLKSVNKAGATLGDNITYAIRINNPGNVSADGVKLIDTIPQGTSLIANSVTVNGIVSAGANPAGPNGVSVGSIAAGNTTTVTFQIKVDTIPSSNEVANMGYVAYQYTLDPSIPNGATGNGSTNTVKTAISIATLDLTKSVNKNGATVGEEIDYTISLKNTGNVSANNVVLTDTIPTGISLVANSLKVNGVVKAGANINPPGYTITEIPASKTITVTYKVKVDTIPNPNIIDNSATAIFNFNVDPSVPNGVSGSANSNVVKTTIGSAEVGVRKSVDKAGASIGEELTYTITLKNTGNVSANNINFIDTIPAGTTFVSNSVSIDGVNKINVGPSAPNGITISSIAPGSGTTIMFKVKVTSAPITNIISNSGIVTYYYTVDPSVPNGASSSSVTNTVTTAVGQATLTAAKSVDKKGATLGDIIGYAVVFRNIGNISADNIIFIDTIPNGTSFVANSVEVNGIVKNGGNPSPPTGIDIGSVPSLGASTVTFKVKVDTIPSPSNIKNSASATFKYTIDPSVPNGGSGGVSSNEVSTTLGQATLSAIKIADKKGATIDDEITYTIGLKNTGNLEANSVTLIDTIPEGLKFIDNSLMVNGIPYLGTTPVPPLGASIGNINPGKLTTVTFKAIVTTVPGTNPIPNKGTVTFKYIADPSVPNGVSGSVETNTVTTAITKIELDVVKSSDKAGATIGEIITYAIKITNPGNTAVNNVALIDTIPQGTSLVPDSITIDGVDKPTVTTNPPSGVNVGTIDSGGTKIVSFQVKVETIPNENPIKNSAYIGFNYTLDPSIPNGGKGNKTSNEVKVNIGEAKIKTIKSVDKIGATLGEEIKYTIGLKNSGNVSANNVMIIDTIPKGTEFVSNSLMLNEIVQAGATTNSPGYDLGNIPTNTLYTVTFKVKVVSLPNPNIIVNNASVAFKYTVDPANPNSATGGSNSNSVETIIGQAVIDATKLVDKVGAAVGDKLKYTINMTNSGNISANDVKLKDTIPSGTILVNNSVKVNGVAQPSASPQPSTGITVGKIDAGNNAVVTFQVEVITIPSPSNIKNSANINFSYTSNPSIPNGVMGSSNTNEVTTNIGQAQLSAVKSTDKVGAAVGDVITYAIGITNTGNLTADQVFVKDTIPSGTVFVQNSVMIGGINKSGADPTPPKGIDIGAIESKGTVTVSFKVTVITVPAQNPILNSSTIEYNYTSDPSIPNGSTGAINTNTVKVNIGIVELKLYKSANKEVAKVNDEIEYSISMKNSGNIPANNVVLIDTIPEGTEFVPNSLKVGSSIKTGQTPQPPNGTQIGSIPPGGTVGVGFKVKVLTIPASDLVKNDATANFEFSADPSIPNPSKASSHSNTLSIPIKQAEIEGTKSVNISNGKIGDELIYTIVLKNKGNVIAENVNLIDTIPDGTTLVVNSLRVNGVMKSINNFDAKSPLSIGVISARDAVTITFAVTVMTIPTSSQLKNSAFVNYKYTIDSKKPSGESGSINTSEVITSVKQAVIDFKSGKGMIKSTDKPYATLEDMITYSIALKNTGNVDAKKVILIDTLPYGMELIPGSVERNGQSLLGESPKPPNGVNVGDIKPGSVITISFKATVVSIPNENPIENNSTVTFSYFPDVLGEEVIAGGNSNPITNKINYARISTVDDGLLMTVDKTNASIGNILTYSVRITNTGNAPADNVIFTDVIPTQISIVPDTVTIDGILQQGDSPLSGVPVGKISPGETKKITFKAEVNNLDTFEDIVNKGRIDYHFTVDPNKINDRTAVSFTNEVITGVKTAIISSENGGIMKYVDKEYADLGKELTYTLVIKNTGNITANNVVVYNTIPAYVEYIPDTTVVNEVTQLGIDPSISIHIGDVEPQKPITINYKATVIKVWSPSMKKVSNNMDVYYEFTVN